MEQIEKAFAVAKSQGATSLICSLFNQEEIDLLASGYVDDLKFDRPLEKYSEAYSRMTARNAVNKAVVDEVEFDESDDFE